MYNVNDKYDHNIMSKIDPDMNYPQLNDSLLVLTTMRIRLMFLFLIIIICLFFI